MLSAQDLVTFDSVRMVLQRMNGFISALCFSKTSRYLCTAGEDLDIMVTPALHSLSDSRTPAFVLIRVAPLFDRLVAVVLYDSCGT